MSYLGCRTPGESGCRGLIQVQRDVKVANRARSVHIGAIRQTPAHGRLDRRLRMEGLVPQRWQSVRRLPRPGGLEPFERWIIPEMSDLRQRPFLTRRGVGKRKYRILHPRARRQGEQADVNKRAREPTAPFGSMLGSCQAGTEPFGTAQLFRPYTASCWYHPRRPVSGRSTIRSSSHDSKLLLLPHGYCQEVMCRAGSGVTSSNGRPCWPGCTPIT